MFKKANQQPNFAKQEEEVLKFWKDENTFEKSVDQRSDKNRYVFYDGPPFITGTPHYGSLLSSIAKDVVPRYFTMKGKKVERVWGWDAHGLPIENKVEKLLGLHNRREIEKMGIQKFIDECYKYTQTTSAEWEWYVDHIGRWVDFKNAYTTIDQNYMESVLWVFKELYNKDLIYKGLRTSLYCTRCGTPVSNFEIAMDNSYADMEDPAVTIKFPIKDAPEKFKGASILAWTTTPWTLPSNRALVVDDKETYALVKVQKLNIELEKGWLVKELPADLKKQKSSQITQAYLNVENYRKENNIEDDSIKQVRIRKQDGVHTLTFKKFAGDNKEYGQLIEENKEITKEEYIELIKKSEGKVTKTRYYYPLDGGYMAEVDIYQNNLEGYNVVEVEFSSLKKEKEFKAPEWFGKEVTDCRVSSPAIIANMTYAEIKPELEAFEQKPHNYEANATEELVILAKKRMEFALKNMDFETISEFKGKELLGLEYEAPYDFFPPNDKDWKVYAYKGMVHMEEGTGIVHSAPGFGDIDTDMGKDNGLTIMRGVDDEGKFVAAVKPWVGVYVKEADPMIIEDLKKKNLLFKSERIVHRYPYCWRCQTPLIHRAQDSWFISIESIKDKLLANNENINWVPEHLKTGRFKNGIEMAPDWCISRTRYWATPMPVWQHKEKDKCDHTMVFGSIKEIEEASGQKVVDLHRPKIDEIIIKCEKCGEDMHRIKEVLDVWLDSASMPYAQLHYPFDNKEKFEENFPADFIVEYIAQTRAWFYVMHVISTALFNKNSFKNVVTTGVIFGTDGRKMSKSYGNYPDPKDTLVKYGGDALRLYLMGARIMVGEDINFNEAELQEQIKTFLLPLWNSYSFLTTYANIHNWSPNNSLLSNIKIDHEGDLETYDYTIPLKLENKLDEWIVARLQQTIRNVRMNMDAYVLPNALRELPGFLDDLSKWYIRRSRERFANGDQKAFETLYYVLVEFIKLVAPFAPFVTETIYQDLVKDQLSGAAESIHLTYFPQDDLKFLEGHTEMLVEMETVRELVTLGQAARVANSIKVKQPLGKIEVVAHREVGNELEIKDWMKELISEELNIKDVIAVNEFSGTEGWVTQENTAKQIKVALDTNITEELKREGVIRELIRNIQATRKQKGLSIGEKVKVKIEIDDKELKEAINIHKNDILEGVGASELEISTEPLSDKIMIEGKEATISIEK